MSAFEEERKSSSKSPIDDSFRDIRLLNYSRPFTAKKIDLDTSQKIPKKNLARANPSPKPKRVLCKDRNTPLLSKLKPTRISVDKEKLYIDNMALKVKLNDQKSLILRFKAKISQLEKEVQKKEDLSGSLNPKCNNYLVKLLKQTVKDLRQEVQDKILEISKQKQNMKLSKYLELELEVKAYMDECTRLRHSLEEILKDKDLNDTNLSKSFEGSDTKTLNLLKVIEENNREIQKLKDQLKLDKQSKPSKTSRLQEDYSKLLKELENLKKKFVTKEKKLLDEVEGLKQTLKEKQMEVSVANAKINESNLLIQNLFKELKSLRQKKKSKLVPPKCLQVLHSLISGSKMEIFGFLQTLNPSGDLIETKVFLSSLKKVDQSFGIDDLELVMSYIKSETTAKISIKKLVDYYNSYDFSTALFETKEQKVLELFQHLNLRMQLHRIPKDNLIEALIGAGSSKNKQVHYQEIVLLFTNSPFSFSRKEATNIVNYLFGNEKSLDYPVFIDKFYASISTWEVFTATDEENFDNYLLTLVAKHKETIENFCLEFDKENKETITLNEFFTGVSRSKITVSPRLKDYLIVLFYSHNMELNSVPYKQFVQAYSNTEEVQADPKTSTVQKYLDLIAEKLLFNKKSVREVFMFDNNGLIVAEEFIDSLKCLEITDVPKEDLLVLLDALQYDPEQRIVCVHIDELEDILETYGVSVQENMDISGIFSESEKFADYSEGHVQKISLLDSAQLGLTETPEPGPRTS